MYYINEKIKDLYRSKFHDQRGDVLRLDMNESPTGLPEAFVEEVKKKITGSFLSSYPEKEELIAWIASHNGIDKEEITLTSGSDEAMRLIFQCFAEAGKELLTVYPTFEMYDVYSKMFGMEHVTAEYGEDFQLPVENLLSKITLKTGLIVLLNPNSPIGNIYSKEDFEKVMQAAKDAGALVVVDEAYHYFCETTFLPELQNYDGLIVLRTFSKLCSIAGLRVGYAAAKRQIIQYLENAQSTFNVNNVGILFATELLKREDMLEDLILQEREGHEWLADQLKKEGYRYYSNQGNYVLVYPRSESGSLVEALKEKKIWIRDYGRGILKGWVRVSTGDIRCMRQFWSAFLECDSRGETKERPF